MPTCQGFSYLAVVVDAWSRRVVGWAMQTHLKTGLVLEAATGEHGDVATLDHDRVVVHIPLPTLLLGEATEEDVEA